jgi:catechol 2,3-dioxygenase-like lactoylglutathione lyase family enzyme
MTSSTGASMATSPPSLGLRSIAYLIVFVRDMRCSLAFYRDKVGLPLRAESPNWIEFDLRGTTLALHPEVELPAGMQRPQRLPAGRAGIGTEVVFYAPDPLATRDELLGRGVRVAKPKMVHDSDDQVGIACLFEDLDGNVLSLYGIVPKHVWNGVAAG